jgi:uncharacterized protein YukE
MTNPLLHSRLAREQKELESVLAEFEHEARRVRDQLERRGGRGFLLEDRLEQLQRNITATWRELNRVRQELATKSSESFHGKNDNG